MSDVLLSVEGLAATYNHAIRAVSDVSFAVRRGEIVAVLGANGAGKSTTLQAISALLPARRGQVAAGRIIFDGREIVSASPAKLVRAGIVPVLEDRHCFPSLTVEENLITGAIGRGAKSRAIRADLDEVYELFPRLKRHRRSVSGLTSGGEQQMTAIGRALMSHPRLLVLDEPSMGLAPLVVEGIFRALKQLNSERGLSILVAEQNSTVALRFADHAVVLESGRSALSGASTELRSRDDIKTLYLGGSPQIDVAEKPLIHAVVTV
ncbi:MULTISPECIES: ABC transporter ATP-binding protein [unclassified Bradyrhizobium]|uniref:ABC transporter ATP-binding protein n=1 Tax=unclassified Bradyrhizobium TaxID=2631580 RepID=UPI002304095A|nr:MULTISPECIES: ABC transporter ATP-binding protein [unclassified Bradyrhizobium]MDA9399210.1 branched-chain amino acid ABC transporter ATP-binding protein [Bradyrhizobium sp. CCBAU 45389]MDA9528987.1 branched-chain amino acid ABC transporter ATP-binding protein [Bradyrhizobium sp. CCBAU 25338]